MPSALICGSLAYDTIMVFQDQFKNHILPDKVHILNVSFLVPRMRREFGGCAGNIAYNLKLLGGHPIPMATVGQDFGEYRAWLDGRGLPDGAGADPRGWFLDQEGRVGSLQPGWHADHVDPVSGGGATEPPNGRALCPRCNLVKGAKPAKAEKPRKPAKPRKPTTPSSPIPSKTACRPKDQTPCCSRSAARGSAASTSR